MLTLGILVHFSESVCKVSSLQKTEKIFRDELMNHHSIVFPEVSAWQFTDTEILLLQIAS